MCGFSLWSWTRRTQGTDRVRKPCPSAITFASFSPVGPSRRTSDSRTQFRGCFKKSTKDLSGGLVVNLPANAGVTGSIPGPGRSHMLQGNSPPEPHYSRAREPQLLNLQVATTEVQVPWSLCSESRAPQYRVAPTLHN